MARRSSSAGCGAVRVIYLEPANPRGLNSNSAGCTQPAPSAPLDHIDLRNSIKSLIKIIDVRKAFYI
jgi:hypothetical protein